MPSTSDTNPDPDTGSDLSPERTGVYPGSFNPPTTAHLAIADAARQAHELDSIHLTVSLSALAKQHVMHPRFEHRIEVLTEAVAEISWLEVRTTEQQLLVDIGSGYDLLIVGADKWWQIQDPVWYDDDPAARDEALARLPTVAVAPRDDLATPDHLTLDVDLDLIANISSTDARAGNLDLMLPAARRFAEQTGAWIEPPRYELWVDQAH